MRVIYYSFKMTIATPIISIPTIFIIRYLMSIVTQERGERQERINSNWRCEEAIKLSAKINTT